ncbi:hypothetical protein K469DRAFT_688740 [Zopfia rhizophila CBS 207.26]|uniref:Uncharacterized protein n=1 Tax=Zopfia rhizophila CBS 207.26 TaxID=1314779 RepID=A0A6A6DX32_9PEZI|nr:hypothetical protein K469DRAFT_688740 [Zopfia rhizophila CBS 207.26]
MSSSQSTVDDPTLYEGMVFKADDSAEQVAMEHGESGSGHVDTYRKATEYSPHEMKQSSQKLSGEMERMSALVDVLFREIASQDARISRLDQENSHIMGILSDMGDWLDNLGDNLKERGKILQSQSLNRERCYRASLPAAACLALS